MSWAPSLSVEADTYKIEWNQTSLLCTVTIRVFTALFMPCLSTEEPSGVPEGSVVSLMLSCSDLAAAWVSSSCLWSLLLPFSCHPSLPCGCVIKNEGKWLSACTEPHLGDSSSSLTSVTAKLRFPQGTTLYHLSCRTSMKPWDLYWLIRSEMFEVSGELGGRPMPYPRRKNSTITLFFVLFLLMYVHFRVEEQAGTLFQPANSTLVYCGLRMLRQDPFLCKIKSPNIIRYKQNKQIQNYYSHTRNMLNCRFKKWK